MQSESARSTTRSEARFRIDYPNSVPRAIKVIPLDEVSRLVVDEIATLPWTKAVYFRSVSFASPAVSVKAEDGAVRAWLQDIAGQTKSLTAEIDTADLIVMVASAGNTGEAALLIGEACKASNVTTIGLIIEDETMAAEASERTLKVMRQCVTMLAIARGADYVGAMLTALRA